MSWMTSMSFTAWRTRSFMTRLTAARVITPIFRLPSEMFRTAGGTRRPTPGCTTRRAGRTAGAGLEDPRLGPASRTPSARVTAVWDYCVPRGIAFKFLRNEPVMLMVNSKSAPRGSSGKLVTIYPTDEAQLELMLKELDELLHGVRGPYILSDLRYGEGPLFVRYGASSAGTA